jgi:sugar phosphate isomerase/epimerase
MYNYDTFDASRLLMGIGRGRPGEWWAQLRQSFTELLGYSEGKDLVLLIEPAHEAKSTLILTVADGLRMIDEIGSERLGILLDTRHANVNGEDLAAVVRSLKDVPLHIHIDDNHGDSDAHLVPGEGTIDFQPFVQALKEIDYQGFVSGELGFGYTLDPDTAVQETYAVLSDLFA